jgi:chemotaxis protein methyltransferase CheR
VPRLVVNSEFFLNLTQWETLRDVVLPQLLRRRSALRAWSAGCHVGKEPYSLAILLDEVAPGGDHVVLATENDPDLLERARAGGPFDERDVDRLSELRRRRYLRPDKSGYYVTDALRRSVRFEQHDLLRDPFARDFDLILFRDVQPFLSAAQADTLHRRFHASLAPGGVLFVGATDTVPHWEEIGFERLDHSIYRTPVRHSDPPRPGRIQLTERRA